MKPRVRIVSTGGTIANTAGGRLSVEALLEDLIENHPDARLAELAELSVVEHDRRGSAIFRPGDWVSLAGSVQEAVDQPDVDAVVVTHGTYSVEETAFFLHLVIHTVKPVVFVCAQRKYLSLGSDAAYNLLCAIRVAGDEQACRRGVLVVVGEEIHSAREVLKGSERPGGFYSPVVGPLGTVSSGEVAYYRSPSRLHTYLSDIALPQELPRVDVVSSYAGADGACIDAAVAAGARGLVINGFAYSGRPHFDQLASLSSATSKGIVVGMANRGQRGRSPRSRPAELESFVTCDNLPAQKARILMMLALAQPSASDMDQVAGVVQEMFDVY